MGSKDCATVSRNYLADLFIAGHPVGWVVSKITPSSAEVLSLEFQAINIALQNNRSSKMRT